MPKILFLPYGKMLAHTTRPVEIAKEIAKNKHEIIFAGEGNYMQLVKDEGFECVPLYTVPVEGPLNRARQGRAMLYSKIEAINCYESEVKLISRIKPDLVITDFRCVAATSCATCNTLHITIQNALWTNFYAVPLRAPEHFLPTKIFGSSLTSKWMPYLKKKVLAMDCVPFNKVRKLASMDIFTNCFDAWLGGTATLLADLEEWARTINRPENVHYIGPIIWEPKKRLPHWYHDIRKNIPTIYFTMGSTGNHKYFDLLAEIPTWR